MARAQRDQQRRTPLAAIVLQDATLSRDLRKLRLVLCLIAAPRGSKLQTARVTVAQCRTSGFAVSVRSLFYWQARYLSAGFAGLTRKERGDSGYPRDERLLSRLVDAAIKARRRGDIARLYRGAEWGLGYEQFRAWIRRLGAQLRVIEMPKVGGARGHI